MWKLAAVSVACLLSLYVVGVTSRLSGAVHAPAPGEIVIPPLSGSTDVRSLEWQSGGARARRICSEGRCELLAGDVGQGFRLLASYPSDRWVVLRTRPSLSLGAIRAVDPRPDGLACALASLTPVVGALLAGLLLFCAWRARVRMMGLNTSRGGEVGGEGELRIDTLSRAGGPALHGYPPGPVTLIPRRMSTPEGLGPYRASPRQRWSVLPGSRDAHLRRDAALWGAACALLWAVASLGLIAASLGS